VTERVHVGHPSTSENTGQTTSAGAEIRTELVVIIRQMVAPVPSAERTRCTEIAN
jgi:hypothetical protein